MRNAQALQEITHKLQRQHDNKTHVGKQDSFNMTFRMFRDVSSDMTDITDNNNDGKLRTICILKDANYKDPINK